MIEFRGVGTKRFRFRVSGLAHSLRDRMAMTQERAGVFGDSARKRSYSMSPAALAQRREASRQHGLYAEAPPASPSRYTPWERRKMRIRKRADSLLQQFPHLDTIPRLLLDAYVEVEMAKAALFNQLMSGKDCGHVYDRASARWQALGTQLGILQVDAATTQPSPDTVETEDVEALEADLLAQLAPSPRPDTENAENAAREDENHG